ncbi:DUF305 domain-containing protein [Streptomyces sp. NPDC089919]|uniref:DUF305 domain-containing protein n=1 Tax=Streptomyces sp. NPDC089919 TaxID=3155188 RepID=UPI00341FF072
MLTHPHLARAAALGLLAIAVLAGCDSGGGGSAAGPGAAARDGAPVVVAPGRPGGANRHLTAAEAARERPDDSPDTADFSYVNRMIEHHRQALTMSALAPARAGSAAVRRLAERIAAAQRPEIGAMEGWLAAHPDPAAGAAGMHHDHAGAMPGMATPQQLAALTAARGAAFDRRFLELMTAHHRGALTMAGEALADGNNTAVEEMATEVIAQQGAEIDRMRAMG